MEAVIEEKDTLIKQNVSSRILLLRTPYRVKVSAPDYFKPTLPYIVQVNIHFALFNMMLWFYYSRRLSDIT